MGFDYVFEVMEEVKVRTRGPRADRGGTLIHACFRFSGQSLRALCRDDCPLLIQHSPVISFVVEADATSGSSPIAPVTGSRRSVRKEVKADAPG